MTGRSEQATDPPADPGPSGPGVPTASEDDEPASRPVQTGGSASDRGWEAVFWIGSFAGSADGVWLYRRTAG